VIEKAPARTFERIGGMWVVNGVVAAPIVVGAGGHFCPVARHLRGHRPEERPVVAKEAEFRLTDAAAARTIDRSPELFFCRDMQGYAWCVRKGAYLNVGIGRRDRAHFADHVRAFTDLLIQRGTLDADAAIAWKGHAYRAAGVGPMPIVGDGMLLCGDAAGLAFPESGEGIAPAIESGLLAARALIAARPDDARERLADYAAQIRRRHPPVHASALTSSAAYAAVARALLRSRAFTRHVLLDRWFLRRAAA
jgi:flavin-dependent dehydrogenase